MVWADCQPISEKSHTSLQAFDLTGGRGGIEPPTQGFLFRSLGLRQAQLASKLAYAATSPASGSCCQADAIRINHLARAPSQKLPLAV